MQEIEIIVKEEGEGCFAHGSVPAGSVYKGFHTGIDPCRFDGNIFKLVFDTPGQKLGSGPITLLLKDPSMKPMTLKSLTRSGRTWSFVFGDRV